MAPKVLLGITSYRHVEPQAYASHLGLVAEATAKGLLAGFDIRCEMFIAQARNEIALSALARRAQENITHLWFVDDDMIIPPGTLGKLLALAGQHAPGCISALYTNADRRHQVYSLEPFGQLQLSDTQLNEDSIQVAAVGLGCCLISCSALERVVEYRLERSEHPFEYKYAPGSMQVDGAQTTVRADIVSEDIWFFDGCKACEVPVYVAPRIVAGHVKPKVVVP